jgi:transposase
MGDRITFAALDVHNERIVVAVAEDGAPSEVPEYSRIANTPAALGRLAAKVGRDGVKPRFCYEAGSCGYGIQRRLSGRGHACVVEAPSLIPKRPGNRVKTNRRDGASLAGLHQASELTAVSVRMPSTSNAATSRNEDIARGRGSPP